MLCGAFGDAQGSRAVGQAGRRPRRLSAKADCQPGPQQHLPEAHGHRHGPVAPRGSVGHHRPPRPRAHAVDGGGPQMLLLRLPAAPVLAQAHGLDEARALAPPTPRVLRCTCAPPRWLWGGSALRGSASTSTGTCSGRGSASGQAWRPTASGDAADLHTHGVGGVRRQPRDAGGPPGSARHRAAEGNLSRWRCHAKGHSAAVGAAWGVQQLSAAADGHGGHYVLLRGYRFTSRAGGLVAQHQ